MDFKARCSKPHTCNLKVVTKISRPAWGNHGSPVFHRMGSHIGVGFASGSALPIRGPAAFGFPPDPAADRQRGGSALDSGGCSIHEENEVCS